MRPEPGCPKHMIFGPCGGVRPDHGCEIDHHLTCPFTQRPLVAWAQPPPEPHPAQIFDQPEPVPGSLLDLCTRRPV
nr:methylenetetrahydrofolate reductase C-terminal domain-containing protein [Micromonospora sp. DSM 115978]